MAVNSAVKFSHHGYQEADIVSAAKTVIEGTFCACIKGRAASSLL